MLVHSNLEDRVVSAVRTSHRPLQCKTLIFSRTIIKILLGTFEIMLNTDSNKTDNACITQQCVACSCNRLQWKRNNGSLYIVDVHVLLSIQQILKALPWNRNSAWYFFPILTQFEFSRQIFIEVPSTKFHRNLSNASRAHTRGQTDGQDAAYKRF
jgi:hypothetical protein